MVRPCGPHLHSAQLVPLGRARAGPVPGARDRRLPEGGPGLGSSGQRAGCHPDPAPSPPLTACPSPDPPRAPLTKAFLPHSISAPAEPAPVTGTPIVSGFFSLFLGRGEVLFIV